MDKTGGPITYTIPGVFRRGTHHKVHQTERKHDNLIIYDHHLRTPFAMQSEEACMSRFRIVNAREEAVMLRLHPLAKQSMRTGMSIMLYRFFPVDSIRNGSNGNGNMETKIG